ncbi:thiamine ABC transporter substrate binding subunit [Nocardioides sp.]|uniref:thiamine ABC transporter substrate-binding protein n=1 Tax=Nocardioides sp. TaxID=35761 RepID=UPI003526FFBB
MSHPRPRRTGLLLAVAALALASCSLTAESDGPSAPATSGEAAGGPVVLVTHESFALPKKLIRAFEAATGYTHEVRANGDAGTLTNKLVLTQGSPTGDVAFGVDNTFASRALDADVFDPADVALPPGAEAYALPEGGDRLLPIDSGSVCVNIDTTWFRSHHVTPPATLADLTEPAYRDLFVTPGAPTSSPGMAFLLTTIAAEGDSWPDYWSALMANGTRITSGWSDAYFVDFTQGGGDGTRPIVLSYDSSPAFTVKNGRSTTKALLDTCFQQVEYAGVLAGAANPAGARAFLDFLLSPEVQAALPESMYVFPVRDGVELPADWARFAKRPTSPYSLDPAEVDAHRDEWLTTWQDVTTR